MNRPVTTTSSDDREWWRGMAAGAIAEGVAVLFTMGVLGLPLSTVIGSMVAAATWAILQSRSGR